MTALPAQPERELIELTGHIIDSLTLAKILDLILEAGADYRIIDVDIGRTNLDPSTVHLEVTASDHDLLAALVERLQIHGANRVARQEAVLEPADRDGVLPVGFYATTNLPTRVLINGRWLTVDNPEMDCGLVVDQSTMTARTVPMHRIRAGDLVVVGMSGVEVDAPERPRGASPFEFMTSEVSPEKPKALLVAEVARRWSTPEPPLKLRASCTTAGSTSCSPGTASPPTTSRQTCWERRSASPWGKVDQSSTAMPTTCE